MHTANSIVMKLIKKYSVVNDQIKSLFCRQAGSEDQIKKTDLIQNERTKILKTVRLEKIIIIGEPIWFM